MYAELITVRGNIEAKTVQLPAQRQIVVGRGEDVDLQVLDKSLSRKHCTLEPHDDTYLIRDAESRHGTWVNGERIDVVVLKNGDHIEIGSVEFEFQLREGAGKTGFIDLTGHLTQELEERLSLDRSELMLPSLDLSTQELQRAKTDLATIYKIGNVINAEDSQGRLYERILDAIFEVVHSDRALLLLTPEAGGEMELVSQRLHKDASEQHETPFSRSIAQECVKQGVAILRANAMEDAQFGGFQSVMEQNIHSVVCVPVESAKRILGVIYTDSLDTDKAFSKHDLELVAAVGRQAGIAIERSRLFAQVRRMLYSTVRALVASIEAKDEYTRGHSERVTAYSLQLARGLKVSEDDMATLELAGLLHDVGKIGVDDRILRKPGKLSDEEFEVIRQHPAVGSDIVREVEEANVLAAIVRHHHERWDGSGYPDGLKEKDNEPLSRIVAVADAYDAMTSARPYRQPMAIHKVVEQLRTGSGEQFDPDVVAAFFHEYEHGGLRPS